MASLSVPPAVAEISGCSAAAGLQWVGHLELEYTKIVIKLTSPALMLFSAHRSTFKTSGCFFRILQNCQLTHRSQGKRELNWDISLGGQSRGGSGGQISLLRIKANHKYRISHGLWMGMIIIQQVVCCFLSSSLGIFLLSHILFTSIGTTSVTLTFRRYK